MKLTSKTKVAACHGLSAKGFRLPDAVTASERKLGEAAASVIDDAYALLRHFDVLADRLHDLATDLTAPTTEDGKKYTPTNANGTVRPRDVSFAGDCFTGGDLRRWACDIKAAKRAMSACLGDRGFGYPPEDN
jgi:hypothetical protein